MGFPLLKDICILCLVLPPRLQSDCCNPLQHVREVNHSGWYNRGSFASKGEINTKTQPEVTSEGSYSTCVHVYYMNTSASFHLSWMEACLPARSHSQHWEQKPPQSAPRLIPFTFSLTNTTLDYKTISCGSKNHMCCCMFSIHKLFPLYTWFILSQTQHRHADKGRLSSPVSETMMSRWGILQLEDRHTCDFQLGKLL